MNNCDNGCDKYKVNGVSEKLIIGLSDKIVSDDEISKKLTDDDSLKTGNEKIASDTKFSEDSESERDLLIENGECDPYKIQEKKIDGRVLISFDSFMEKIKNLDNHSRFGCTFKNMVLINYRRSGLRYKLFYKCDK